jgi:hypothetical protein
MKVKVPVAASILYTETLFEPEFATKGNFSDGSIAIRGQASLRQCSKGLR